MSSGYYSQKRSTKSRLFSRLITWLILGSLISGLVAAGYFWGLRSVIVRPEASAAPRPGTGVDYYALYVEQKSRLDALFQEVTNLRIGAKMDIRAVTQVRDDLARLKKHNAQLEQDVTFYRDLMTPNSLRSELALGELKVTQTKTANMFKYSLVVIRPANSAVLKGYLEFDVVGVSKNEKPKTYSLSELSSNISTEKIPLSFKYFQRIEGEMLLPEGFSARTIALKAVDADNKKVVSKKYEFNQ